MTDINSGNSTRHSLEFNAGHIVSSILRKRLIESMLDRKNRLSDRTACLIALMRQDYLDYCGFCCGDGFDVADERWSQQLIARGDFSAEYFYGCWIYINRFFVIELGLSRSVLSYLRKAGIAPIKNEWMSISGFEKSYIPMRWRIKNFDQQVQDALNDKKATSQG